MSNNVYGIKKPALINLSKDVDIWYHYRPTRSSEDVSFANFKYIDPTTVLSHANIEPKSGGDTVALPGMYNLSLPVSIFGRKGFYTIYITPKEYDIKMIDVGTLAAYPDIKGIIINSQDLSTSGLPEEEGGLVGYRIEYKNGDGNRESTYRIVTSNNLCEPIAQNLTTANTESDGYRFTVNGSLHFITVTPSMAPAYKANATPYIGEPNKDLIVTNTKFDPVMIEVEMTEHDFDTLSYTLEGNQIRSLDRGLLTTYNENGEIYKQHEFYTVKDNYTNNDTFEVKKERDTIDYSPDYDNLMNQ